MINPADNCLENLLFSFDEIDQIQRPACVFVYFILSLALDEGKRENSDRLDSFYIEQLHRHTSQSEMSI